MQLCKTKNPYQLRRLDPTHLILSQKFWSPENVGLEPIFYSELDQYFWGKKWSVVENLV